MHLPELNIRLSTADDGDAETVRRLATLGQGQPPSGPVMLAELDGRPVAAMALADGSAVVDPVRSDPSILTLLRLRRLEARLPMAIGGA